MKPKEFDIPTNVWYLLFKHSRQVPPIEIVNRKEKYLCDEIPLLVINASVLKSYLKLSIQKFLFVFFYQSKCLWSMKARDYEMIHFFFPEIFHFVNKASHKPGYKELISIQSVIEEWFTGFKSTMLMIKW